MQPNSLQQRARTLRKNMTESEKTLWTHLRYRRLNGLRFRRQVAFDKYIVDFVCLEPKIIIELDGSQHQEQHEYDNERTKHLESLGYVVLRFWNSDITDALDTVLETILNTVIMIPPSGASHHLPPAGEGVSSLVSLPSQGEGGAKHRMGEFT